MTERAGVAGDRTKRSAFFQAYRSMAISPEAVARLRRLWAEEEEIEGLPLSEEDFIALASELAIRGADAIGPADAAGSTDVAGSTGAASIEAIVDAQLARIENPDRRARFAFVRPSLSPDPLVREAFFQSLRRAENREGEPWVAAALSYLHHPSRADHAERFILPSLELLEEIQRTGDIFFPSAWLDATLSGHVSPAAAEIVQDFLSSRPDYPRRLRRKILQSADFLFRAAEIRTAETPAETENSP